MERRMIAAALAMVTLGTPLAGEEAKTNFELVPARLVTVRDGLGNVFEKLRKGKEVRVAYFGGSITAAAGWRVKTLDWFKKTYPAAKISEINAAIGGTGSDLGVYRFRQDVLQHKPDLVFVEFAVNDGGASPENIWRGMEGIVRQAWKADPTIDICYVYTLSLNMVSDYEKGLCSRAASADEKLAEYYGIPSINVALRTVQLAGEGKLIYNAKTGPDGKPLPPPQGIFVFTGDSCHPTEAGHQMYSETIADALKQIEVASKPRRHTLKPPMASDNWEEAKLVPIEASMLTSGWRKLSETDPLWKSFHNRLPDIWVADKPGERITFRFKGTTARLFDLVGPDGAQAIVTVDGKRGAHLVPRFDSYCSYHRLSCMRIAEQLPDAIHTVEIEIHPEQPDRSIVAKAGREKPGFDPKKYDGTAMRVGYIMLLGDIVR